MACTPGAWRCFRTLSCSYARPRTCWRNTYLEREDYDLPPPSRKPNKYAGVRDTVVCMASTPGAWRCFRTLSCSYARSRTCWRNTRPFREDYDLSSPSGKPNKYAGIGDTVIGMGSTPGAWRCFRTLSCSYARPRTCW